MHTTPARNILLALLLSLALTFTLAFLYAFYPLILGVLSLVWKGITSSGPQTGGIGAVAGGVSVSLTKTLAVAAALFLIIFPLLQKRSAKQ